MRTLPQVTGPTERALGALLDRELLDSRVPGFLGWVAMNLADAATPGTSLRAQLERATQCGTQNAGAVITQLVALGLLESHGALTTHGAAELGSVRERVSATTQRLVAGLAEDELSTTIHVLDHVRDRAESLLKDESHFPFVAAGSRAGLGCFG
jgi:hypothetical protein